MWKDFLPEWTKADGPESDVVVSTRARLARNLAGAPFPSRAAAEDLEKIASQVRTASPRLIANHPDLQILDLVSISEEDRTYLVDAHLASPQQVLPRNGGLVLLEPGGKIAIMVNEEDHLRIQAILPGLQTIEAWDTVDEIDDELAKVLEFAFFSRLGYLTASLSNLGTGLRISAMMHLAGLSMMRRLGKTLNAVIALGVSVRGIFGEGSKGLGDLYQVSNEVTLGAPEREFAERVRGVAMHLLGEERKARDEILSDGTGKLNRAARQSLVKLRDVETVSAGEALALLSPIRLAAAVGAINGLSVRDINELMVVLRVMRLDEPAAYASMRADRQRAVLVRRRLRGIEL
jgi:protein arginine kinase